MHAAIRVGVGLTIATRLFIAAGAFAQPTGVGDIGSNREAVVPGHRVDRTVIDERKAELADLVQQSIHDMRLRDGKPLVLRPNFGTAPLEGFFNRFAPLYGLSAQDEMKLVRAEPAIGGIAHEHYQQYYRDVPVLGASVALAHRDGYVVSALGGVVSGLDVDVQPALDAAKAQRLAVAAVQRTQPGLRVAFGAAPAVLVIVRVPGVGEPGYRLAYRVSVQAEPPPIAFSADIDALDGRVLGLRSEAAGWAATATTAASSYYGPVVAQVEQNEAGWCRLHGITETTRSLQHSNDMTMQAEIVDQTGVCDFAALAAAATVHWGAQRTAAFYFQVLGRDGYDDDGTPIEIYVDVPAADKLWGGASAFKDKGWLVFGDTSVAAPVVELDVVGHEFTHLVIGDEIGFFQDGFDEAGEPHALEESFSDIFAALIELRASLSGTGTVVADWVIGTDGKLTSRRSLVDPHAFGHAKTYLTDPNWDPTWKDTVTNATVPSHAFYLLSEGGAGINANGDAFDVSGVGPLAAGQIAYKNLTEQLDAAADFLEAREGARLAAIELCGEGSLARVSTETSWYAAGLGSAAQEPMVVPPDTSAGFDPWLDRIEWQFYPGEGSWHLQVSTTADFSDIVVDASTSISLGGVEVVNGTTVGFIPAKIQLKPATSYFWRVRRLPANPTFGCWSAVRTFTTLDKTAEALEPSGERRIKHHPWDLTFRWTETAGATGYDIEIYDSGVCQNDPAFYKEALMGLEAKIPVLVERPHAWRVRPRAPGTDNVGSFSPCIAFETLMPRVKLVKPLDFEQVYPWPVDLVWEPEPGAQEYILQLTRTDGLFEPLGDPADIPLPKQFTHYQANVAAFHSSLHLNQWWRVFARGPELKPTQGSPFHEFSGEPVENGAFLAMGEWTKPKHLNPPLQFNPGPVCINLEAAIQFRWTHVPNAAAYRLTVWQVMVDKTNPILSFSGPPGPVAAAVTVPANPSEPEQAVWLSDVSGPMAEPDHVGFGWTVVALGPEGLEGFQGMWLPYFIQPPPPTPMSPPQGQTFCADESVEVTWETPLAPHNTFYLEVLKDPLCSTSLISSSDVPNGFSAKLTGFDPGSMYFWRVRPSYVYQACQHAQWSSCSSFQIKDDECGNGCLEKGEDCDDGNTANGDGCPANCSQFSCNEKIQAGGSALQPPFSISLSDNEGEIYFAYDTVNIPDRIQVFHDNQLIAHSGPGPGNSESCVGTTGSMWVGINGGSAQVTVEVDPNCDPDFVGETAWAFYVGCPEGGEPDPPDPGEE